LPAPVAMNGQRDQLRNIAGRAFAHNIYMGNMIQYPTINATTMRRIACLG
jgi:hypothetical protein